MTTKKTSNGIKATSLNNETVYMKIKKQIEALKIKIKEKIDTKDILNKLSTALNKIQEIAVTAPFYAEINIHAMLEHFLATIEQDENFRILNIQIIDDEVLLWININLPSFTYNFIHTEPSFADYLQLSSTIQQNILNCVVPMFNDIDKNKQFNKSIVLSIIRAVEQNHYSSQHMPMNQPFLPSHNVGAFNPNINPNPGINPMFPSNINNFDDMSNMADRLSKMITKAEKSKKNKKE